MRHYRLPVRADSVIDELRLLEHAAKLLRQCYMLHAQADLTRNQREGTEAFLELTLQEMYDLKFSPLRIFILSQIVRDLKALRHTLWEAIPTEDMPIQISTEFASAQTVPKIRAV